MRRIVTTELQAAGAGAGTTMDTYFDRVIKYIPADIVGAWVAITGLVTGAANVATGTIHWIMFVVMTALTALWTLKQTAVPNRPPATTQAAIATGSFVVWVFALGGPFATLDFYRPLYGSLLLIIYTLATSLVTPKEG